MAEIYQIIETLECSQLLDLHILLAVIQMIRYFLKQRLNKDHWRKYGGRSEQSNVARRSQGETGLKRIS